MLKAKVSQMLEESTAIKSAELVVWALKHVRRTGWRREEVARVVAQYKSSVEKAVLTTYVCTFDVRCSHCM